MTATPGRRTRRTDHTEKVSRWLARLDPSPTQRSATVVLCLVAVLLIGLLDYSSVTFSFSTLYLVPVMACAIIAGPLMGSVVSLAASIAWVIVYNHITEVDGTLATVWNGIGRFVTLCLVAVLIGALKQTIVRLAASDRRSREFLATAAHQLRTPIAGLIASAEAISLETDPDVRERLADNLIAGTNRTRRLLASLLEISRLDSGPIQERRAADLGSICRREVDSFATAGRVEVRYDGPASLMLETNGDAVREALSNLIDNAVRHAEREVSVTLLSSARTTSIVVRDDGPGLPHGSETRVFERFVSLDGAGGSGLGLPIARASVNSIGGTVEYEDQAFRVRIPTTTG